MNTTAKIAIAVGAVALTAITVWGAFGLNHSAIVALDRWGAAAPDAGKTDAVLDHINRPCKGASGPDACGTLAQINKTSIDAGDAVVRTQLIERASQPHIISAMDEFGQTAKHLSSTADSLKGTADALTGTAQGATDMLSEGKRTIAAAQPLLDAYTQSGDDLDVLLKRKSITDILDNVAGMTVHANSISGEFDLVTQKAAGDYLSPKPWWRKIGRFAGDTYDYGALFARHTP